MPTQLLMSFLALALLLPAMWRRHQRRLARASGVAAAPPNRKATLAVVGVSALLVLGVMGGGAFASDGDPTGAKTPDPTSQVVQPAAHATKAVSALTDTVNHNTTSINMVWLMVGGVLVLFMQAGFALVETGFTRAKNGSHTMMMNLVIFALGVVGWFVCGYALMFGSTSASAIGLTALGNGAHVGDWQFISHSGFFLAGRAYDVSVLGFFFFQLVFMDATATIPTGAMAERWKFTSFCVWGLFASAILYPIYGNWVWGGGWLSQLGVLGPKWGHGAVDFAGSGVVHAMGGVAAFWGARTLGARIGKFDRDGKPRAIPGHHLPMAFLGTFVLLVGWMGFNGASTFAGTDLRMTVVIVNTILASAFGCLTTMFIMWKVYGKPDPSMTCNGLLAGLVAITAPCAFVAPWGAMCIGIVAGGIVVAAVVWMDHKAKVDDPVGAVAVHGANGLWGIIAVGLFADGKYGDGLNGVPGGVKGLFTGGGVDQLLAQITSAIALVVFCSIMCYAFFKIMDKTMGMRVKPEEEVAGLDMPLMGALAYPDFLEAQGSVFVPTDDLIVGTGGNGGAAKLREEVGA
ncbi:MAG: ammonium transporter [Acidimicrobiia bacterium]